MMTLEQIEHHRKKFEEVMRFRGFVNAHFEKNRIGCYLDTEIQSRFFGYIMAIESIEIELPMPVLYCEEESPSERNHRYSYNTALNHAKQKIQLSCLKVKE